MGIRDSVIAFLRLLLRIFAMIVRFGGSMSVVLLGFALFLISDAIAAGVFGAHIEQLLGLWGNTVVFLVCVFLSLLFIYALKRIGGLEK